MTQRSPIMVLVYTLITFGIYGIYWFVKTKDEMNAKFNTQIPTAWFLIIPILNLLWLWKYWNGVQKVTGFSGIAGFLMTLFYLSWLAMFIAQGKFNTVGGGAAQARAA
jgi:hypothetical protein